jgi:hypothetical protein
MWIFESRISIAFDRNSKKVPKAVSHKANEKTVENPNGDGQMHINLVPVSR